ncbi:PREDICTED: thyroid receptor-interacting protein 11-like isoform X1 [Trachymyrmex septentrionalis]|uniref:thyroid receptor-interacting protein 11-like isoform X1 n=1 Tax=Trachymyrmex septentrionalis TaxID=34720 RepID=UPI00084F685F|nr:PREDICTED: thyroid receptor-interacting protein 11-like isoform X1 [Trachymyrmex septentrionalis]
MAWFGDSLSSISSLKGHITNLTREVLSDGIVDEIDERSKELKEANERCIQLQDLLTTKDAEISLLRRQNCELQRAIIEINAKSKESRDANHSDEAEGIFWEPSCVDNRNAKNQNHVRQLQEQLAQATVKVRELECELKHVQKVNASFKDDISDGHQKAEVVRAKQDMLNRIIQMEEKTREAERNAKHIQLDEASLINDFRSVISKLNSLEKFDLISGALKALQIENEAQKETIEKVKDHEKSNQDLEKVDVFEYNSLTLKHANSQQGKSHDTTEELLFNKEEMLHERIKELQIENKDLRNVMEKLDEEYTQSIENLLSVKEESNKKHRSLQNEYDQLSVDYNEAKKKIIELRNDLLKRDENTCTETIHQFIQTDNVDKSDKHVQITVSSQEADIVSETSRLDDITEKVKIILKNCTISNTEPGESIFEAIAKQYVDAKWKLDVLERKITEVTRDLKETEEMKDGLQMECEELQSHIDSLLLEKNMRMKSCQGLDLNLPSIPETSEERVASLEMDIESLREEVKRLLTENKTIQERNSTLMLAVQSNEVPLTNNDVQGNINRKLYTLKEENKELPIALGESKNSNAGVKSIEQLKLDHENVKGELKLSETKSLHETNLTSLQDTVNKLTEENKDLLRKNEHLDMQLHDKALYERDLQEETGYLLEDLQKRLNKANCEKLDLENDILHKEEKLAAMLIQVDMRQSEIVKLYQDNDRLIKENTSLSEQLTATHDESLDKIELLNTEMSLLQQEHEDLKQEILIYKEELPVLKEKLYKAQQQYIKLENEYAFKLQSEQFQLHKKNIQSQEKESENESSLKESFAEELNLLRDRCKLLEQEIEMLRTKETQELKKNAAEISSTNIDKTNKEENLSTKDNLIGVENAITDVNTGNQDLTTRDTNITSNEQQTFKSIVDEERREKDIIKARNENLIDEINDLRSKLQTAFENNNESAEMAKQTIEDLSHIIRKKDQEINILQAEITHAKNIIAQSSNDLAVIRNQKSEMEQIVSIKHNESSKYQNEIQKLIQRVNEQAARIQELIFEQTVNEMRSKANVEIQQGDHDGVDSSQGIEIMALNKKCDALEAALMQEQSNTRILQNQLMEIQNKEANSAKELERLRTHLVEMESSYTEEALIAENNRQELEARLLQAEEKVKSSSTAFTSANIRANQQVETLQQQIALITQQRDQIQAKLSAAEDNIQLQSASLTNLQIVLEQFQQDKERDVMAATERLRSRLAESYEKQDKLADDASNLQQQLREARECLKAASRLSEQLEKKDEQIERFNEEVIRLTASLNFADQKVKEATEHDEGKVDKVLIKNLLLGYLASTTSDKSSILRVFANVLDFTEPEKDKTGLNNLTAHSNRQANKNSDASLKNQEASLSTAFVRFLESESKPKPQLPALPIVNSPSSRPGYNKQQSSSSSSAQSTLLLSNVALPTFPDFIPARNTGSILKEVLKDS